MLKSKSSSNQSGSHNNLALPLWTQFDRGGQRAPPHSDRSRSLNNIAPELCARFHQGGQQGDLGEVISMHKRAVELFARSHPYRSGTLNNLASALWRRFQQGGQQGDLEEAISLYRQALELCAPHHRNRSSFLYNLASVLFTRFVHRGQRGDLNEAILLHRQALELRTPPHPDRSDSLNNLASALWTRFKQGGQQGDLEEAISLNRQALEPQAPPHPDRSSSLNNLALALWTRFEQGGQRGDLNEAISLHRQALELRAPPHPLRSGALNNLASALWIRFKQEGRRGDLDEAISLHRQALELFAPPHPNRSGSLSNLALALWTRFEQEGQRDDLDEAISLHRQSLELCTPHDPNRSSSLNNLALTLWTRFQQGGQQGDLDEAILLHRQALEFQAPPHPNRSGSLDSLASALWTRFQQEGRPGDLDEAISLYRQALELRAPPHPLRSTVLNNLASALWTRFKQEDRPRDLHEAISLSRQALELQAPHDPFRPRVLNNLASLLWARFEEGGQREALNEAISLYKHALELFAPSHPDRCNSLYNLANLLMSTYSKISNDSSELAHAMSLFSEAIQCPSKSPSQHFRIAKRWAYHADLHQHPSAMEAYDAAMQILPQLVALNLDIQSRHKALTVASDGLACRAARCAIEEGQLDKAVEYLETGRAVFWSQLLHLRSPMDKIHALAPELAERMRNIATMLEHGSHRDIFAEILDNRKKMILEEEASRLARLEKEWSKAIEEVRGLAGFEDFLRPSRFSSLQEAAAEYPVILLISNENSSHCLIVTSKSIHCIALPSLPIANLRDLVYLIQAAASQSQILRSSIEEISQNGDAFPPSIKATLRNWVSLEEKRGMRYEGHIPSDHIFRFVLKTIWNEVVKYVIDFLGLQKSENPPVLQWCPTGLFSFLPIHAAGCYESDDGLAIECASDYIISSYTPTIGVLLAHNLTPSTKPFKMMIVIQSQELPSTKTELAKIEQYALSDSLIKLGIPGTTASVEAVASHLSDVSIAHFACHGKQDRSNPLDSGLKLEDGMLLVSRIMKEPMLNGSLAFLSACETARGDGNLPDEAMSLAASLLFSGFRHVIATMWEMRDEDGPTIAENFYKELFCGPEGKLAQQPDTGRSAQALHAAVKTSRSKNVPFHGWVPFIHMGK